MKVMMNDTKYYKVWQWFESVCAIVGHENAQYHNIFTIKLSTFYELGDDILRKQR
jgi:hypothetical protein